MSAPDKPRPANQGRRVLLTALGGLVLVGFAWYVVPQIHALGTTLRRLEGGNVWWLALAVLLEAASIAGDIFLFRGVFSRPGNRIGTRTSTVITLAGTAAERGADRSPLASPTREGARRARSGWTRGPFDARSAPPA